MEANRKSKRSPLGNQNKVKASQYRNETVRISKNL